MLEICLKRLFFMQKIFQKRRKVLFGSQLFSQFSVGLGDINPCMAIVPVPLAVAAVMAADEISGGSAGKFFLDLCDLQLDLQIRFFDLLIDRGTPPLEK